MQEISNVELLYLKPRGLPVLTTTGIESPKNLLNSLVCNAHEIRPGKGDRRFSKKRDGFGWIWKKWKMKQRPKSFVFWSGRWESNPTPIAWKLLNVRPFFSRLWNALEHNRGYFLDGFTVSIPQNVSIDPKSDAGICVP